MPRPKSDNEEKIARYKLKLMYGTEQSGRVQHAKELNARLKPEYLETNKEKVFQRLSRSLEQLEILSDVQAVETLFEECIEWLRTNLN